MEAKILVVDDEPQVERLLRQRFRQQIKQGDYHFVFTTSGKEALDLLEKEADFDIVLSDINMPQMDGLTFIGKLRESFPQTKAVMVSAYGDMNNIRAAMNLGAFDFVTKPINFEDLDATIKKTLEEVQIVQQAARARDLELNNEKLRELDRVKSTFFTNISHEFRTPLTVISGMAEQIEQKPDLWMVQGLHMIKRNSTGLLNLVNQILDLAKLESGKLKLSLVQDDVIPYLKYLVESFRTLAALKKIALEFQCYPNDLLMDHDYERIQWVVSNLISNAIKFTPEGGSIEIEINQKRKANFPETTDLPTPELLFIKVTDTGIGIPSAHIPFLFDRFYQVESKEKEIAHPGQEGSGIGLALTRELIQLMEGTIWVESEEGKGTTFRVALPIRREADPPIDPIHFQAPIPEEPALQPSTESAAEEGRIRVLLVEDNPDVLTYIRSCLEESYELFEAYNGKEGLEMAIQEVPDLVVSDVMMPEMDGFDLCKAMKADIRTSHIPLVLLTAKADQESRISGLKRGADAYLAKPFNREELLVRLEQLLDNRKKLQARYRNVEELEPSEDEAIQQEDAFLARIREELEKNLDDETLGISGLARAIGVSRAQLHNKVKALTGHSPSVFVRTIRLHKAKELLRTTDLNVTQVAYEVGFRDPAYFSRTFSEEFGHSPKEVRK